MSQPTLHRILNSARGKTAKAGISSKNLKYQRRGLHDS
ncbi:hypothetical protein [Methanobacterium sp.]|nr:hypothetical protein [Methanobacterium sp.]